MTEIRYLYQLNNQADSAILNGNNSLNTTEADSLRAELEDLERRLIPLLITIQRALGKEPTVQNRMERRRG
jgi:hypothetical protein